MKILSFYDGTIQSKTTLEYGIKKAKEKGAELIVLQIFESSLFIDYDAGPKAEEIARSEAKRFLQEAEDLIREKGQGARVRIMTEEGNRDQELLRVAKKEHVDLVLATPRCKGIIKSSTCPVHIIPGTILVPIDSSDTLLTDLDLITSEAEATGSEVLLMGVVPIHLYSKEEKKELEDLKKSVDASVKKIKKALSAKGVRTSEIIRSGYPDEEILRVADEYAVSLIMLPAGGKTPSELTKAAAILLDEPERARMLIQVLRTTEA